jgi:hypothetical protein
MIIVVIGVIALLIIVIFWLKRKRASHPSCKCTIGTIRTSDGGCQCINNCQPDDECGVDDSNPPNICGKGTCSKGKTCIQNKCECVPNCQGRECGEDGCGGWCGRPCTYPNECHDGKCTCIPNCEGKECGQHNDGCGGPCGYVECPQSTIGYKCRESTGQCDCIPKCDIDHCSDDGCGGSCDSNLICPENYTCNSGSNKCECTPNCQGKCGGPDGCGGSCVDNCDSYVGENGLSGWTCDPVTNTCQCKNTCDGVNCNYNIGCRHCGKDTYDPVTQLGGCPAGWTCPATGNEKAKCVNPCDFENACKDRNCGPVIGCENIESCGTCAKGFTCNAGKCV